MILEFISPTRLGARRLLWFIALTFCLTLLVHYILLPYGIILSSFFTADKVSFVEKKTSMAYNATYVAAPEASKTPAPPMGDEANMNHDIGQEKTAGSSGSLISAGFRSGNESSFVNYTMERVNDTAAEMAPKDPAESQQIQPTVNPANSSNVAQEISSPESVNFESPPPNSVISLPVPAPMNASLTTFSVPVDSNSSLGEKVMPTNAEPNEKQAKLQGDLALASNNSSNQNAPMEEKHSKENVPVLTPLSEMRNLWLHNRSIYPSIVPRWPSRVDAQIQYAKSQIENASVAPKDPSLDPSIYWNISAFGRSYDLMGKMLKVYVYQEGEKPIWREPEANLEGIYASESWFMKHLITHKRFVTRNPMKAHLFYLPFSSFILRVNLFVPGSPGYENLTEYANSYVDMIAGRYPFWNRTEGADHFLVACHDWAPNITAQHMGRCIRALCNANILIEPFVFGKDVSLPTARILSARDPLQNPGGRRPSERSILAFYAGQMHGYLRPKLVEQWGNSKYPDMKIFGLMTGKDAQNQYYWYMQNSKYCICPRGYGVHTPRIVEAISYECVPVIIADNYVPPFLEVLNWEAFAVFVLEKDMANLRNILLSIPQERYLEMQMRVKNVQQHFLLHDKPVKYDMFHMILHSIWYSRLAQINPR